MAVAVRSANSGWAEGSGSKLTVPAPVGVAAGDLLLAVIAYDYSAGDGSAITAPAGWTQQSVGATPNGSYYPVGKVFTRVATSADVGSGISYTFGDGTADSSKVGTILALTGADPATPIAVTPSWASGAPGTTGSTPALAAGSGQAAGDLTLYAAATDYYDGSRGNSMTAPSGTTDQGTISAQYTFLDVAVAATAGTGAIPGVTFTANRSSQDPWRTMALVVNAAVTTPQLVATYTVDATSAMMTSPSLTPAAGELIVVKAVTGGGVSTLSSSGISNTGGLTLTNRIAYAPTGLCPAALWTGVVGSSPSAMTISVTLGAYSTMIPASMVIERWSYAGVSNSPSLVSTSSMTASAPSVSGPTTTGTNSVVTWIDGDSAGVTGAAAYRSSAVQDYLRQVSGKASFYSAYQAAANSGTQTLGMTTPSTQKWTLAAIEVQYRSATTPQQATASPSGAGQIGAGASIRQQLADAMTGAGQLNAAAIVQSAIAAALVGQGQLAANAATGYAATASPSGQGSLGGQATLAQPGKALLSGQGSLSGAAVAGTPASPSGQASLGPNPYVQTYAVAGPSGQGSLGANPTVLEFAQSGPSGQGSLVAAGVRAVTGQASPSGQGSLVAAGLVLAVAQASPSGQGGAGATGWVLGYAVAGPSGQGSLVANTLGQNPATAGPSGQASLGAAPLQGQGGAASPTGQAQLGPSPLVVRPGAAALVGAGALSVAGLRLVAVSAALTGAGSMVVSAGAQLLASASPTGTGSLSAAGLRQAQVGTRIAGAGQLGIGSPTQTQVVSLGLGGRASVDLAGPMQIQLVAAALGGRGSIGIVGPRQVQLVTAALGGVASLFTRGDVVRVPDHGPSRLGFPAPLPTQGTRVIAQDILSGQFLSWDLPVDDLAITWTLSGATQIAGAFAIEQPEILDLGLTPWGTWIHVEEDGEIRASAILRPVKVDEREKLTLNAGGFTSWAKGQPYFGDFTLVGVDPASGESGLGVGIDPADIVREIWRWLQSRPGGDLGVEVIGRTGVTVGTPARDVDFTKTDQNTGQQVEVSFVAGPYNALAWYQGTDCGTEMENQATQTPFDYRERCSWNADRTDVLHWLEIGWPRLGGLNDDVRFDDQNMLIPIGPEEPDERYASEVIVFGAGQGSAKVVGRAAYPRPGRIPRTVLITDQTITTTGKADAEATANLAARQGLADVSDVTVMARHENAHLGDYQVGDDVALTTHVPWGGDLLLRQRVMTIAYSPDTEVVKLALRSSGSFDYGGSTR